MIVVIQCAATKDEKAGKLRAADGKPVLFVADPARAPQSSEMRYARPDDLSDYGASWRELLLRYNERQDGNPFGLLPAIDLYENSVYHRLSDAFGMEDTFILSAGWGLISGSFLTPDYDITFSQSADPYKRRRRSDLYRDLCQLPADTNETIFFFGGKDYVPLFVALTKDISAPKTVFYNSAQAPVAPGCTLQRFETTTRTNWHYECANAFIRSRA